MKSILIILMVLTFTPKAPAMFGHVQAEKERRHQAEKLVSQERQDNAQLIVSNQRLHITVSILSASVVTALIIGAAIGSKTRRDHDANF